MSLPIRPHCSCALAFVLCCLSAPARAQPVDGSRAVRTFDFEERRLGNREDLPMHWAKVSGAGLPHYVNGGLAQGVARGGEYAFRFDLNGGGLVYRYEHGQIPARQGGHYRVEGYVRTTVLPHARARLSAHLADVDGHPLAGTVRHSELYAARQADEPWKKLAVELSAESPRAAWVVVELALLQPQHYAAAALGKRAINPQDIRGTAWFDDVTVSQVPRVVITTGRPAGVFRRSDPLRLTVHVDDRFTDDLAARLAVRDAAGKPVYQRSGAIDPSGAEEAGPGRTRMGLDLPDLPAGWYEASLAMSSGGQPLGAQTLAFVRLADDDPPNRPDPRFGVVATSLPFAGWGELPHVLPMLAAGRVKLAVWGGDADIDGKDAAAFDALLQRFQDAGIAPTACLLDLPPEVAEKLKLAMRGAEGAVGSGEVGRWGGGEEGAHMVTSPHRHTPTSPLRHPPTSHWPLILTASDADWRPRLAYLVSRHAPHFDGWQIGADGSDAFVADPKMRQVYAAVYAEMDGLMRTPNLAAPWPAWYELDAGLPAAVALSVPSSVVLPSQLPLYLQDAAGRQGAGRRLSLTLEWLDRSRYGRDAQVRDLAQRVVHALAADAQRIDLPLPMSVRTQAGVTLAEPDELLLVLRTLVRTLGGAAFKGRVPIADGVEAFLFDKNGRGILALWDAGATGSTRELDLNLGERPVSVDLWGNVTPLFKRAGAGADGRPGQVKLTLGPTPLFLVDIDTQLAQTRASVALDRPLIESSFHPHTRRLRFTNAYRHAVVGSVKLRPPPGWNVTPRTMAFTLNAGETLDKELTIEIPYNSIGGPKAIHAEFSLQGDANATFTIPVPASLGLSDVGMQTTALRNGKDVLVQQLISNYGDKPINYDAFAMLAGQSRQERLVTHLEPGKTTVKRYRFSNVKPGAGVKVRVGVKEQEGVRILNDEVAVQ